MDLHLICGPNEAGKSTAQSAIEDFFFGFGHSTRFAFLHDTTALRVGARLEDRGKAVEARRRKGTKGTLLTSDERPLDEASLRALFGSVDRGFYTRMFSLDHERLNEGGRQILDAKDDVGRMLFEAGSGLASLRDLLRSLDDEAGNIYGPRAAANRTFYQARERLTSAEQRLRDVTISSRQWLEVRSEIDALDVQRKKHDKALQDKKTEREQLERIRRVLPILAELERAEEQLATLGVAPPLPTNVAESLTQAERDVAVAASQGAALDEQIDASDKELSGLHVSEPLLGRSDAIIRVGELRANAKKARKDIPSRQAELATSESRIQERLHEIGRETLSLSAVEAILPPRPRVARVRELLENHGELESNCKAAKKETARSAAELQRLKNSKAEASPFVDVVALATAIRQARAKSELDGEARRVGAEIAKRAIAIDSALKALLPWQGSMTELRVLGVPESAQPGRFRKQLDDLQRDIDQLKTGIKKTDRTLARDRLLSQQIQRDSGAISPEELRRARSRREQGWLLIRRRYIDAQPAGGAVRGRIDGEDEIEAFAPGGQLAPGFELAMAAADQVADKRFEGAKESAQLLQIRQGIEQRELERAGFEANREALESAEARVTADWNALWAPLGLVSPAPEWMSEWLENRVKLLALDDEQTDALARQKRLKDEDGEASRSLSAALLAAGAQSKSDVGGTTVHLAHLIDEADARHKEMADAKRDRTALATQEDKAEVKLEQATEGEKQAEHALASWGEAWRDAVKKAGLGPDERMEAIRAELTVFDELREEVKVARALVDRIEKMQADVTQFENAALDLSELLPPGEGARSPEAIVDELQAEWQTHKTAKDRRQTLEKQRGAHVEKRLDLKLKQADAQATIDLYLQTAGCSEVKELRAAIERASERRNIEAGHKSELSRLSQASDGQTRAALLKHCAGVDPDGLPGRIETLKEQVDAMNAALRELAIAAAQAEERGSKIAGGVDAVRAAEQRQFALAEMQEESERYVRVYTAARLLRWAIERNRKEKQAPLLLRAGVLFRGLTGGAFEGLRVDLDEKDVPHLMGLRGTGPVGLDGMSDGSRDQLFLALRLAALEEYLARTPPLPFIADDLFINFDDARAAAGFRALAELSRRTQVLFFTHHEHLINVAHEALGTNDLSVVRL